MIAAADINITTVERSKLNDISLENIPFGKYFTDHMLEVDYEDGEWKKPAIKPYQDLHISPALAALHYGQAIFEGIKAYKDPNGQPFIFRPNDNFRRFNISAERMQMPQVPEEIFMEGMRMLVELEKNWIPNMEDHSLYIRPFMFSSDEMIGVRPSEKYKFMIILSPTGPYYSAPMRIYVEEKYVRAAPGGVGYAKAAGNYGSAMYATAQAKKDGYDQVLWTDAFEHKYVQECGTMNVFFIIGGAAITPDLSSGTILEGVTRDSAIVLLKEMGFSVEERPLSIDDIIGAHKAAILFEVFGTGTAATISMIKELRYKDYVMEFDVNQWRTAPELKRQLNAIRYGLQADDHGWMFKV
ncbi:MAG TPA: branched-chain amino acid aminotransferase [Ferruginibacter sp.]|nr:branched-chain amino acid aminotransferase [Ferruginibacter sp.]